MTRPGPARPAAAAAASDHPDEDLLDGYATGSVDQVTAWSVEAHVTICGRCRSTVAAQVGPARLARNREAMLVRVATDKSQVRRLLARCGVPDHVLRLVTVTPSLRLSWILSVVGVLAVVCGEALLATHLSRGPMPSTAAPVLLPFLLTAPLLVLASVAGAFLPWFDPAYSLAVAAPFSGFTLLLARSVCALATSLVPVVVAGFVVPGPGWLPAALLLPSLSLCAVALAGAVTVGPRAAAIIAAALWTVPVVWVGVVQSPELAVQWRGQVACVGVLVAAVAVLFMRRARFEIGWAG